MIGSLTSLTRLTGHWMAFLLHPFFVNFGRIGVAGFLPGWPVDWNVATAGQLVLGVRGSLLDPAKYLYVSGMSV